MRIVLPQSPRRHAVSVTSVYCRNKLNIYLHEAKEIMRADVVADMMRRGDFGAGEMIRLLCIPFELWVPVGLNPGFCVLVSITCNCATECCTWITLTRCRSTVMASKA